MNEFLILHPVAIRAVNTLTLTSSLFRSVSKKKGLAKKESSNNHKFNDETFCLFNETANGTEIFIGVSLLRRKDFRLFDSMKCTAILPSFASMLPFIYLCSAFRKESRLLHFVWLGIRFVLLR